MREKNGMSDLFVSNSWPYQND